MFCRKCGMQLADNPKFCPHCGTAVHQESGFANPAETKKANYIDSLPAEPAKKSFREKFIEEARTPSTQTSKRARIKENKMNAVACCPKCGSTSLAAQKKGFGIGKAIIGASLTGGIGLVAGNLGAKKVRITCMNCGKQFMAGK